MQRPAMATAARFPQRGHTKAAPTTAISTRPLYFPGGRRYNQPSRSDAAGASCSLSSTTKSIGPRATTQSLQSTKEKARTHPPTGCPSRRVVLIWDNLRVHFKTAEYFSMKHPRWFRFECLQPYCPEFSRLEAVWSYLKYGCLANFAPLNVDHLRQQTTVCFNSLRCNQDLLPAVLKNTQDSSSNRLTVFARINKSFASPAAEQSPPNHPFRNRNYLTLGFPWSKQWGPPQLGRTGPQQPLPQRQLADTVSEDHQTGSRRSVTETPAELAIIEAGRTVGTLPDPRSLPLDRQQPTGSKRTLLSQVTDQHYE